MFTFHPGLIAILIVAAVLLLFGLSCWKRDQKRLACIAVGVALTLFGLCLGVIEVVEGHARSFHDPHCRLGLTVVGVEVIHFRVSYDLTRQFPWLLEAAQWLGMGCCVALGAGLGLAFAVRLEIDARQRELSSDETPGEAGAAPRQMPEQPRVPEKAA